MLSLKDIVGTVVKPTPMPKPPTKRRRSRAPRVTEAELEAARLREVAIRKKTHRESEWLTEFTRWVVGDPRLSAWEVGFIANVRYLATGGIMLSPKQGAAVERIRTRLGYDPATISLPPATPEELAEATEDAVNTNVLGEPSSAWEPPPLTRQQREHIDGYMFLADSPFHIRFGAG